LAEATLAEQLRGLRSGCFNAGFAHTDDIGDGIVAEPIWIDPLVVAVSARHPLLAHKQVPLEELVRYPLVMADPGCSDSAIANWINCCTLQYASPVSSSTSLRWT
jgi:DNA-binding transcriptional LysR family regulator